MKRNIIAIVYDFDGTLSPQPMQEYTVFPQLNIKPSRFWEEVKKKECENQRRRDNHLHDVNVGKSKCNQCKD